MDPLSISVSCVSLVATITKVSYSVTVFVREVRDARSDLDLISHELHSLKTVLELLSDDFSQPTSSTLPTTLVTHLGGILKNCNVVINDIEKSLEKHRSSRLGVGGHWTLGGGKDDMAKFRFSLETHKSALELALEMVAITIIRDVKKDTEAIRDDTAAIPDIKNDTAQILQIVEEIARLKARLPEDVTQSGPNFMLQRFLDDSTSYAETVVNDSVEDEPESPVFNDPAHGTDWSQKHHDYRDAPQHPSNPFHSRPSGMDPKTTTGSANLSLGSRTLTPPSEDGQPAGVSKKASQRIASPTNPPVGLKSFSPRWIDEEQLEKSFTEIENTMPHLTLNPTGPFYPPVERPYYPPEEPNAMSTNTQQAKGSFPVETRPTSSAEYAGLVAQLGINQKYFSLNHSVMPTNDGNTNWDTHRYTAMACNPSELAKTDFTFRQISQQRETMLMIGIYCPTDGSMDRVEFDARIGTTLESIVQSLSHIEEKCGRTRSRLWWGETVVVCIFHNYRSYSTVLGPYGLRSTCSDNQAHHCGIEPHRSSYREISAHMWEHTSLRTKFAWDRKGRAEVPDNGSIPLQVINLAYTKAFKDPNYLGYEQHLSPFIQMLGARSCISIMAGDKVDLDDVLSAYRMSSHKLSTIQAISKPQDDLLLPFEFSERYCGVPTRFYSPMRASSFDASKRSKWTRMNRFL